MRAIAGLETGLLRIGAFLSACATFVPPAIGAFEELHPGVEVRLSQEEPMAALPRLVAGELDLAVIFKERDDASELDPRQERIELFDDAYRVVLHPSHRLARRREIGFADLRGERFIAPRAEAGGLRYRKMVENWCAEEGFQPKFAYTVDDVTVARTFAAAGLALGIMPEMTVGHPRPDVAVKPIRGVGAFRTIEVRWLRGRRAAAIAPMVAQLRKAAGSLL